MSRYPRLWEPDNAGTPVLLILDLQVDRQLRLDDRALSRNLTDNSSERNELHMESGGLFSDSL